VTGSDDKTVKVIIAETGEIIYDIADHDGFVSAVLFTSNFFISASDDRQVTLSSFIPRVERE
jgi:WD40 repeat protein